MKSPSTRTRGPASAAARLVIALGLLLGAAGCDSGNDDPPAPTATGYPEGTVIVVEGHPILAEEVERYVPMIAMIEPQFVHRDHLRKVLSNISIPTAAGAALVPEDRQAAFERAQALLATARETGRLPDDAPAANVLSGPWRDVGMVSWFEAMSLEPGSYSALHETPGAWTFIEFLSADAAPGEFGPLTEITVRRYDVPYLPDDGMRALIQEAIDTLRIEIIDPDWEALVPPLFLYKPRPETPPR